MIKSKKGYRCPVCLLSVCNYIADLEVSVLGLYNDSRFPGRCILVLREHAENFSALNQELTQAFVADAQLAARAIARAVAAKRVNYAILGNARCTVAPQLTVAASNQPISC